MEAPLQRLSKYLRLDNPRVASVLWALATLIPTIAKIRPDRHNNFTIFRSSWFHLSQCLSLYQPYPSEYNDIYLYGPLFALLIAPISMLPEPIGYMTWMLGLSALLLWAISKLELELYERIFVGIFSVKELITGLMMMQYNVAIGAMIILAFAFIERDKIAWATFFIVLATLTKIYGVVALAFFPFCRRKWAFVGYGVLWTILLLAFSGIMGIDYTLGQYVEWFETLQAKHGHNLMALMQNISLLGIIRKTTGLVDYPDWYVILPALVLWGLSYLRFAQYQAYGYRLAQLSSVLLVVVLLSSGSESSSYVICVPGIALWYLSRRGQRNAWDIFLMIGTFILTSWSTSDIFPKVLKQEIIYPYALKALFPSLIWLKLCFELLTVDYLRERPHKILCA